MALNRIDIVNTKKTVQRKTAPSKWDQIQSLIQYILDEAAKGDLKKPSKWTPWRWFKWAELGWDVVEKIIKIFK